MILKLANGRTITLDDITKDPKAAGLTWLRQYQARKEKSMKPQIEEMTAEQCYRELDRLALYRQTHGRGRNAEAAHVRQVYCPTMRAKVKKRLKQLGMPSACLDGRVYGPGQAVWQGGKSG